jgi:hypothetical protein
MIALAHLYSLLKLVLLRLRVRAFELSLDLPKLTQYFQKVLKVLKLLTQLQLANFLALHLDQFYLVKRLNLFNLLTSQFFVQEFH